MLLLEAGNKVLADTIQGKVEAKKREPCDVHLCDFDDVTYHVLATKENADQVKISMSLPCYSSIKDAGAEDALKRIYGPMLTDPEPRNDITLNLDLNNLPGSAADVVKNIGHLKNNVVGGVFDRFFDDLNKGQAGEPFKFDLRSDTSIFIFPNKERVTVVFSLTFYEKVDLEVARVFLQEFAESRRTIQAAPPVTFNDNPPMEMKQFGITEASNNLGYISFAILPSHVQGAKKEKVTFAMQSFRNYLQYHIKCSKAYFHSRMRARVVSLLKVLSRAKVENEEAAKTTMSGKAFVKK